MYCIKCGVELADSERSCPLCKTPVYYPNMPKEVETPYPKFVSVEEKVNPRGVYFILSFLFLIGGIISAICDISLQGGITWSGYVIGALVILYATVLLPLWFPYRSPAIFAPVDFALVGVYLAYINWATDGDWFWTFGLPTLGCCALIVLSVIILIYYLRRGHLYIFGGACIATGALSVLIEWLLHITFDVSNHFFWSLYPLIALTLFGIMLIVIAIVKPFRESLRKIFAI